MKKSILILAAHPDDAILTMGATMRKFILEGAEVNVFSFGNGDEAYTKPGGSADAIKNYRICVEKAFSIVGAGLECMWEPDFASLKTDRHYRLCIEAVRKYRPDVIFSHYWAEYFQHRDMATISRDAWNQARWCCSADLGAPWKAPKLYHFEGRDQLPALTHYVDVSDTAEYMDKAWHVMNLDLGQYHQKVNYNLAKRAFYGSKIGIQYAEGFQRSFYFPEISNHANDLL